MKTFYPNDTLPKICADIMNLAEGMHGDALNCPSETIHLSDVSRYLATFAERIERVGFHADTDTLAHVIRDHLDCPKLENNNERFACSDACEDWDLCIALWKSNQSKKHLNDTSNVADNGKGNYIGFSHHYSKLHGQTSGRLIHASIYTIDRTQTPEETITYDTDGVFPLEDGAYIQLVFLGDKEIPFTTYRKITPEHRARFFNHVGEIFRFNFKSNIGAEPK